MATKVGLPASMQALVIGGTGDPRFDSPMLMGTPQSGRDATGMDEDTMMGQNPQWARWFDAIKEQSGGMPVSFGAKNSSLATDLPTSPNSVQYGNGLGPVTDPSTIPSLDGLTSSASVVPPKKKGMM